MVPCPIGKAVMSIYESRLKRIILLFLKAPFSACLYPNGLMTEYEIVKIKG